MKDAFCSLSATKLADHIHKKDFSAEESIKNTLERIQKINPALNAIVQINEQDAINQAKRIDIALKKNKGLRKRLLGVPVTIKNVCKVKGFSPDKACYGLSGNLCHEDATVVARLRAEGAIIIGLSNTPEFSIGYETDNLMYGRTNNPYHLEHSPGGSSGGEAAIIAACGSTLGIGTDASGSLRVPAHNTGIATIKATQGRIPFTGSIPMDCMGLFSQFISFGPMARYVEDLSLALSIIAGPDNRDPHTVPVKLKKPQHIDLSTLKVAYYKDDGIATPTIDTKNTIQLAANALKTICASVTEDRPEALHDIDLLLRESILLGGDEGKWLTDIFEKLQLTTPSPLLLEYLELAKKCKLSVTDLRVSWMRFDQFRQLMLKFMSNYDVIICPVAATPAKKHGLSFKEVSDFSYSICYSLVSWPVVVVRCGTSSEGLPIGIQIIAKPWREDIALSVATYLEKQLGGWQPPTISI